MTPFSDSDRLYEWAALSHRGRVRSRNEDAWLCEGKRRRFAVIDGMGGHQGGNVAAAIAREALSEPGDLDLAFVDANARIVAAGEASSALTAMGCVATAVEVDGHTLKIVHVGDTRALLAVEAGCMLLTQDHTVAAQEGSTGIASGTGKALTRDLGGQLWPGPEWIDRLEVELAEGDLLLLCSDGLTDEVDSATLFERLGEARESSPELAGLAQDLIRMALERGGRDNVTVVLLRRRIEGSGSTRGGCGLLICLCCVATLAGGWCVFTADGPSGSGEGGASSMARASICPRCLQPRRMAVNPTGRAGEYAHTGGEQSVGVGRVNGEVSSDERGRAP